MAKNIKLTFAKKAEAPDVADADPFDTVQPPAPPQSPAGDTPLKERSKSQDEMELNNDDRKFLADAAETEIKSTKKTRSPQKWDDKIIAENRRKYPKQIEMLETYRAAMMQTYGINMALPLDIPFQAGEKLKDNDLKPSVFLGKLIEKTEIVKPKDPSAPNIVVTQFEHIRIGYQEEKVRDGKVATFMAANFANDHNLDGKDDVNARRAVVEIVKTALILAQHAKAAGWTEVNFGRTTDPVKRYALMQACKHVGLVCSSETIAANDLPKNNVLGNKIDQHIGGYATKISGEIYTPMEKQGATHVGRPAEAAPQPIAA